MNRQWAIILLTILSSQLRANPLSQIKLSLIEGRPHLADTLIRKTRYSHLGFNEALLDRYQAISHFLKDDYQASSKFLASKQLSQSDNIPYVCHLKALVSLYNKNLSNSEWERCRLLGIQKNEGNQSYLNELFLNLNNRRKNSPFLNSGTNDLIALLKLQYFKGQYETILSQNESFPPSIRGNEKLQSLLKYIYFQLRDHQSLLVDFDKKNAYQDLLLKSQLLLQLNKYKELESILKQAQKKRHFSNQIADRLFLISWKLKKWSQALIYLEMSSLDLESRNYWASLLHTNQKNISMANSTLSKIHKSRLNSNRFIEANNYLRIVNNQPKKIRVNCRDQESVNCLMSSRAQSLESIQSYFLSYSNLKLSIEEVANRPTIQEKLYIDPDQIDLLDDQES